MTPTQSFWAPFLWGLGLLLSWAGWGAMLGRLFLGRGARADLGLSVGWGLCAMLIAGGVLNALRLCSPATSVALVVLGWAGGVLPLRAALAARAREPETAAGRRRGRRGGAPARPSAGGGIGRPLLALLPLAIWGAVVVAASMSWLFGPVNAADDLANYLMYPVKMLETGAALEPFNIRRLATFGGYAYLQAVLGVFANEKNAFLLDAGLGSVVVLLMLVGELRRRGGAWWGAYPLAALCWLFSMPRGNTMCAWIGTATALALVRTAALRATDLPEAARGGLRFALAMAAAACCSLRANYLPLPALFLAGLLAWEGLTRRAALGALLRDGLTLAAAFAVMLLPWSLALYQSSGSLLYPLMKGNHRGEFFSYSDGAPLAARLAAAARGLTGPALLRLLPGVLIAPAIRDGAGLALALAACLTTALTALVYPSADLDALARYTVPLMLAPALYGIAVLFARARGKRAWTAAAAAAACTLLVLGSTPATWLQVLDSQRAAAVVSFNDREPPFRPPIYRLCADTQAAIPRGTRVASLIDFPSLWDYRRHRIECLDFPGAAVPHGPMPFFSGPGPVLEYLRAEGFDYLVYFDFDRTNGMYRRSWYRSLIGSDFRPMDKVSVHALDFMANVEQLARTQPLAFDRDGMKAIRLR